MAEEIVLLRHGEVANPDGIVYASLPGFGLSGLGWYQAEAAADHLATRTVAAVVASPLLRAQQTAAPVAARHGLDVGTDARLTEWGLNDRWAGHRWADLGAAFPGEVDAYWADPSALSFSPESLAALARRMCAAVDAADRAHPAGTVVLVSHQDPTQAARLALTQQPAGRQHRDKPGHAAAITLRSEPSGERRWREVENWSPPARPEP